MHGVWTALITPFNEKNELDLPSLRKILQDQVAAGVTGVVPCGSTGESACLSIDEKKLFIQTVVEELKGTSVKVVAGTGSNDTQGSIEFSKWAAKQGVAGIMLVTPYYNKPSQAGLLAHFRAVADQVNCDVVVYNVPGRTGVSLTTDTLVQLAAHPRIRTLKDATGNLAFTSEVLDSLALQGRTLDILSGDDAFTLPLLSIGAVGVISVASNLFPRGIIAMQQAMASGKPEEARKIHQKYYPLFRDLFVETNPVPIKEAMAYAEWCNSRVRLPLAPLAPASTEKLHSSLNRCGIFKGTPA